MPNTQPIPVVLAGATGKPAAPSAKRSGMLTTWNWLPPWHAGIEAYR